MRFEVAAELPPNGGADFYYPGASKTAGRDGVLLRMYPKSNEPWLAMVAGSDGIGPLLLPDGIDVYCCGLTLNPDDPNTWEGIDVYPVLGAVWAPDRAAIYFFDYVSVTAYGRGGKFWTSGGLALDDLTIEAVDAVGLHCSGTVGYDGTDEPVREKFLIQADTGAVTE